MKLLYISPLRFITCLTASLFLFFILTGCGNKVPDTPHETPIVSSDTNPPIIKILGENPTQLKTGETYRELGAKADDETDGSVNVVTTGKVDTTSVGKYLVTYTAQDKAGNKATSTRTVEVISLQDVSNFDFTNFGSRYLNKIPSDATIEKYDEKRFCMIAGQILSEDGKPLSGVKITIHDHPEYGSTQTDDSGNYSIPSEGGVQLTMRYTKEGHMTIDRQIDAPVQDWVRTPDVIMLQQDNKVTEIKLGQTGPQLHTSTAVSDDRGKRSATLVFDEGTTATVTSKDGSTRQLSDFKMRATEFKIPDSMPSVLPSLSAYTYCADYTVDGVGDDESISFGGKPVVTYVENFLGFEVGSAVPMGYYDREKSKWVAADNGVVVKLLDTDGDNKTDALDSTGDDEPDDLNGDGSFSDEIKGISNDAKYVAGNTYWRSEISHFTPWDYNWPYGPPDGAHPPKDDPEVDQDDDKENDCKANVNSYITAKTRIFHEDIPISGTGMSLHYSSKRTEGYRHLISVSSHAPIPSSSTGLLIKLEIAGKEIEQLPSQSINIGEFVWDGKDIDGNSVVGDIQGTASIGYIYPTVYKESAAAFRRSFGRAGSGMAATVPAEPIIFWRRKKITVNVSPKTNPVNGVANGWTLTGHNRAFGKIIAKGNGEMEKPGLISSGVITTVAKGSHDRSNQRCSSDGVSANDILAQPRFISINEAGNVISTNTWQNCIQEVLDNGQTRRVAGTKLAGFDGDGGQALDAKLNEPQAAIYDSKGNLFILDTKNSSIRKVDIDGVIATIAGNGIKGFLGNGEKAIDAQLYLPEGLAIDNKDNLYVADTYNHRIRKIDTNGVITTIAGNGHTRWNGNNGDGGKAVNAHVYFPKTITVDSQGNVFFINTHSSSVRKINTNGIISTVAGDSSGEDKVGSSGDGGLAKNALLRSPSGLATDLFDNLYIAHWGKIRKSGRVRKVDTHGIITTVVGGGDETIEKHGDGGAATEAYLGRSFLGLAFDSKNNLYISEPSEYRIRKVNLPPLFMRHQIDSSQKLYKNANNTADVYDKSGKQVKSIDLVTGKTLKAFSYDNSGRLIGIATQFNQKTTIKRDAKGNPTLIIAPNGQKTWLTVDEKGDLVKVKYEDDSQYSFGYDDKSLMLSEVDPQSNEFTHEFNSNGRFTKSIDAMGGEWGFAKEKSGRSTIYTQAMPEGEVVITKDSITKEGFKSEVTLATGDIVNSSMSKNGKTITNIVDDVSSYLTYALDGKTQKRMLSAREINQPNGLTQSLGYKVSYTDSATDTMATKTQAITLNNKPFTTVTDYENGEITSTTPEGRTLQAEYDKDTRLTSKLTIGSLKPVTFTYDDKGRIKATGRGSREVRYTYDARGNIKTVTNPRNKTTTFSYDVMDRLTGTLYPDGTQESYRYDKNGNMTKLSTPTPSEFSFTFDGNDSRTTLKSPLGKITKYQYDKNRRLISVTKPSGKQVANHYVNGRLDSTTTPEGEMEYAYYFPDKIRSITKGSESLNYEYNGTLPTKITQAGVLNQSISYGYNNDFATTSLSYAGLTIDYSYDNDGVLAQSGGYQLSRNAANGYLTKLTDGNFVQNISYNDYGEITQLDNNTFAYTLSKRDSAGAIIQKKETISGTTITYDYVFDDKGRLKDVKKDNQIAERYTYDNNGNRTTATVNGVTINATYNQGDQLKSYGDDTYEYDTDGYLIKKITPKGTTTYEYGTLNELRKVVTPDKVIEYQYNAANQRVAKKIDGEIVEKYLWENLTTLLAVYDKNDTLLQRFEYAGQHMPIAMQYDGKKYYLHYDQVGSLRVVSDANHEIVKKIDYDTYGNILEENSVELKVPFGFAGGLYDGDTKLTRFGHRDYDAYTGKWTAKDPIGFSAGDINLYNYVLGDPVNLVDPSGNVAWVAAGAIIGGGLNVASQYMGNGGWSNFSWPSLIASTAAGALGGGLGQLSSAIKWAGPAWAWQGAAIRVAINSGGSVGITAAITATRNYLTGSCDDVGRAAIIGGILGGLGSAVGEGFAGIAHAKHIANTAPTKYFPWTAKDAVDAIKYQNRDVVPKSILRSEIIGGGIGNSIANGDQGW